MKHILLIATILLHIQLATAADQLRFLGVEVAQNLDSFVDSMAAHGFTPTSNRENSNPKMKGQFINRDCTIEIIPDKKEIKVAQLKVLYDGLKLWSPLWAYFQYFEDLLINEYGQPSSQITHLDPNFKDEIQGFLSGSSQYSTQWIQKKNSVTLSITPREYQNASCQTLYIIDL